jgi:hypothetical protein
VRDTYTLFCKRCGWMRPIPDKTMKSIFAVASHVVCTNCERKMEVPRALQCIAMDMQGGPND